MFRAKGSPVHMKTEKTAKDKEDIVLLKCYLTKFLMFSYSNTNVEKTRINDIRIFTSSNPTPLPLLMFQNIPISPAFA